MDAFWTFLDKIGILVGIITGFFTIWTWFYAWSVFHKGKKPKISSNKGDAALIFNLTGRNDISDQVKSFLQSLPETRVKIVNTKHLEHSKAYEKLKPSLFEIKASQKGRIVTISAKGITEENTGVYLNEFRSTIREVNQLLRIDGVNKIHMFYSGPSVLCTLFGSEAKNSFQVALYHYNASTGYVFLGNVGDE